MMSNVEARARASRTAANTARATSTETTPYLEELEPTRLGKQQKEPANAADLALRFDAVERALMSTRPTATGYSRSPKLQACSLVQ